MRLRLLGLSLAALLVTGCRSAAPPATATRSGYTSTGYEAFGLPLESIGCLDFEFAPHPELSIVGYETGYSQRDSVAARRGLQRRMDARGYEARPTRHATQGDWVLVIPLYVDGGPSCEAFGESRHFGLLFERPRRDQ
jgi:hypothetical protein